MVPLLDVNWQILPTGYSFGERDTDVLSLIEEEDLALFTFDGLKRRTGMHPETLSRILSRLEDEGIIKKGSQGYKVTPKITKLKLSPTQKTEHTASLVQTFLPSDLMPQRLIDALRGRWFGLLRWLGMSENDRGVTLKWVTEDGGIQIAANISGTALTIEAKFIASNNLDLALKVSYQLMTNIGKLCQNTRPTRTAPLVQNVAYFGGFSPPS
ncbi:MAG: hypothetical protein NWF01_12195 [Candidatus Bathyarchaeota archaeon]|nr:hypothetical protein [Candidatus Bathyarchaeota archaeon]